MKRGCGVVLRLLGLLLLTGAALKGYQLLTEPLADADLWSNRHFLIFVVEFELALSLWLLSGLYKKAAWLAATGCFLVFSCVTLYKGLTGAASCGCFGTVHVNPWITLFCIDLPALAALIAFRPGGLNLRRPLAMLTPHPRLIHLTAVWLITLSLVTTSTAVLALNEPALVTAKYEVLEPAEWVGKELPILAILTSRTSSAKATGSSCSTITTAPAAARQSPNTNKSPATSKATKNSSRSPS